MKSTYISYGVGWKSYRAMTTMTRKKSDASFATSIVIAFLIVFIVSQLLSAIDRSISVPLQAGGLSALNPFHIAQTHAATPEAKMMIQSHREINIVREQGFTFTVGFKNISDRTWYQKGNSAVSIKLAPPSDRETLVRHKFWRDAETPAWSMETANKPGSIAYYRFALQAPLQAGQYTETFVLQDANGRIIPGSEFDVVMNVWDSPGQFPKKSDSAATAKLQKKSTVPDNSGKTLEEIQAAKLGHLELQQKLQQCGQLILNGKYKVATQSQIEECAQLGINLTDESGNTDVPANTPDTDTNTNTTLAQPKEPATTSVISNPVNSGLDPNGPLIRVGLYHTEDEVTVTANNSYEVVDGRNVVLGTLSANQVTRASYMPGSDQYRVVIKGQETISPTYIRFEPVYEGTVFEITSFEDRPKWNPSLNDNLFLGSLELRHNTSKNRTWVINEIRMENYLKGLAESTNYSPQEYQKALLTAARTYATYHYNKGTKHADEYFTVDATYDQVYKGYNAQKRLTTVTDAVNATKGQIVTYDGKLAITPYFSHSDGRTRSWDEVWGGSVPWAVSVQEPEGYNKTTLFGHGVGMSAYGAILLAEDYDYTYDQILKYYYIGVELADNYNNFK